MDARLASVTLKVVLPGVPLNVAVIIELPGIWFDEAKPLFLVTVATFVVPELQVHTLEMSWVVPSEKVPVAVNCCCVPKSIV